MPYQHQLLKHLSDYKRRRLGTLPAGTYRYRGQDVSREHILPTADKRLNFLAESRETIEAFLCAKPEVTLHKYWHHLNSSQVFALNLFVPFFEGDAFASTALLRAFGQNAVTLVNWEPESEPDTAEETNLDVVWDTSDGIRTFCEVKLSERDFGKARADTRHLRKLRYTYLPRLAPYLSADLQEATGFFASYQILRNIWHLVGTPDAQLVFLIPRANLALNDLLRAVLSKVSVEARKRIRTAAIEDVLGALISDEGLSAPFQDYARHMQDKYVPISMAT